MGEAVHGGARGAMNISEHKATFSTFLKMTEWGTVLIVASVALLTVAFAMGLGWFSGMLAFAVVAIGAGLLMKMGGAWWATVIVSLVLMGIGGGIVSLAFPPEAAAAFPVVRA